MDSNTGFRDLTYLYMTRFVAWYFNFNCNSGANVYCVLRIVNFSTPFYILRYPGDNVVYIEYYCCASAVTVSGC